MNQIMFGLPTLLKTSAVQPSVAVNGSHAIAVYRNSNATNPNLYYATGSVGANGTCTWNSFSGIPQKSNSGSTDEGETPTVAINSNNYVVEIHEAGISGDNIWTHVGLLNSGSVTWGDSQNSSFSGNVPSVAATVFNGDNLVVATYESSGTVYCVLGKIDTSSKKIQWSSAQPYHAHAGKNPGISINNSGCMVLVYEDGNNIYYKVGQLDNKLNWTWTDQEPITEKQSSRPAVALNDNGYAIVAFQLSAITSGNTIYSCPVMICSASIDGNINWNDGYPTGMGTKPSVALSNSAALLVQEGPEVVIIVNGSATRTSPTGQIFSAGSQIASITKSSSTWMLDYGSKTLGQIAIPGAHDAGMYATPSYCSNLGSIHPSGDTQTQNKDFYSMLSDGIRYFDVRPVWFENTQSVTELFTGHYDASSGVGCLGATMDDVLSDVKSFVSNSAITGQVIVLKFSHYFKIQQVNNGIDSVTYDDGTHNSIFNPLIQALVNSLQTTFSYTDRDGTPDNWLYKMPSGGSLAGTTLATITANGNRIIAVFDKITSGITLNSYTYTYGDMVPDPNSSTTPLNPLPSANLVVFDCYSNTDSVTTLESSTNPRGQVYLYNQPANHTGNLYLFSWTLTQNLADQIAGSPSIEDLAAMADLYQGGNVQSLIQAGKITNSNLPNIIYNDYCNQSTTGIALWINKFIYG